MKKKFKIGIIGAGFMSTAIVNGIVNAKLISPSQIIVSDINESNLEKISLLGISVTTDNIEVANSSEFVLFAIKPQTFNDVANQLKNCDCEKFISIMAGVKISTIKNYLGSVSVARCMPNTPCLVRSGAVGIDLSDFSLEDDVLFIKSIFNSFATVVCLPEDKLNVVTGISGSAPAYFYLFAKSIIDSGVRNGLTYDEAKNLVVNTMIGSGKMLLNYSDKDIDSLINAVCSKGGTTIEAIKVYNDYNLSDISNKAINACIKRAEELENL